MFPPKAKKKKLRDELRLFTKVRSKTELDKMAKKNSKKDKEAKKARAEEKNKKNLSKAEGKNKKKAKKTGEVDEDDVDIDEILANYKKEQEAFEAINVETVTRPSKRINVSMVANPNHGKKELFIFGGENTVDNISAFYNELYTYAPDSDQWRKITSKNSPMHRSSAAIAAHPSGVVLLHGGEFSSPKQNTFYHYSDTWLLDATTKEWTKIEQKNGPSARSGHRITVWKNFFIMYGGFRDLGSSTSYLNDLWVFDITNYKWKQIEFPPNHPTPDARSGHSLIPSADGAVLWGGYCKVKAGKGLQKGKILTDCWMLKMKSDLGAIRWERRKKQGFQPSPRVGCSMVHHKGRGVLFGGVYDYEETEESLDSSFFNDLFTYQVENNRWYSLSLRAQKKKQQKLNKKQNRDEDLEELLNSILAKAKLEDDEEDNEDDDEIEAELKKFDDESDSDEDEQGERNEYPVVNTLPHPRFNAATAVVDDSLFIFGGVWELGERDYSIDSLYSIDLAKLDGMKVYWENLKDVENAKEEEEEDEDDFDEEDDEDEDDEGETEDKKLVAEEDEEDEEDIIEDEPEIPDLRPWLPHPKAFESLRAFYVRTGADFLQWAISNNRDARGKHLKKKSFDLCQDRWWERREQVRIEEDRLEELGGIGEVIEKDTTKTTKRR